MSDSDNTPLDLTTSNNKTEMTVAGPSREPQHHFLRNIDPCYICLPGTEWGYHKTDDMTMVFCELVSASDSDALYIRKHVEMDLTNGICTSYVMQHMICEIEAFEKIDVERCIEELHMIDVCIGGPPASQFVAIAGENCYIDPFGNWRHNSCKIITDSAGLLCTPCESLLYQLNELGSANNENSLDQSNDNRRGERVLITNISLRRQAQIKALRKRRAAWYRKKKRAENEIRITENMIGEILETSQQGNFRMEDGNNNDNE